VVAAAGIAAYLAGFGLIAGLGLSLPWRLAIGCCWCADGALAVRRLGTAARRLGRIEFGVSAATIVGTDGRRTEAKLLTGSVVMRRVAWLRFRDGDGIRYQELLVARWIEPSAWHRLQLVWQFRDRGFGHPGGA
jgi:hypothetical protein